MAKNVTRIKSGITINAGVNRKIQKNIIRAKKIIFENVIHVVVKIYSKYYWRLSYYLWWNYRHGTVRDLSYATYIAQWSNKNHSNKNCSYKNYPNEKYNFLYLTSLFINYHCIVDSFWHLMLLDKLSNETETFIIISRHQ